MKILHYSTEISEIAKSEKESNCHQKRNAHIIGMRDLQVRVRVEFVQTGQEMFYLELRISKNEFEEYSQ